MGFQCLKSALLFKIKLPRRCVIMAVEKTDPGEFVDEEAVVLTNPADEEEFDNGVSASFIRFDDMDEDKPEASKEK